MSAGAGRLQILDPDAGSSVEVDLLQVRGLTIRPEALAPRLQ